MIHLLERSSSSVEREHRLIFNSLEALPGNSKPGQDIDKGTHHLTSTPMTPDERRAYEEKQDKQRLALWERECEEEADLDVIRVWIEDYRKGVEQYRVQLRRGEPNRQTDPQGVERIERLIRLLEQKIDIGRRILERRLKAVNRDR